MTEGRPAWPRSALAAWMRLARALAAANAALVMGLLWVFVFTPLGLLMRLRGIDLLDRAMRDGDSYWHGRGERPPEDYKKLF